MLLKSKSHTNPYLRDKDCATEACPLLKTTKFVKISSYPLPIFFRFKSEKTGRGPLVGPEWKNKVNPVMTCYKLVTCEFKWFGLQSRVESFIQKTERRLFTVFHR